MVYLTMIILSVFQKGINYMSSVCWLLSNNSWISAPVSSSFEGCQIPTHWRKKREPRFPLSWFAVESVCLCRLSCVLQLLCASFWVGSREGNAVGTWGKLSFRFCDVGNRCAGDRWRSGRCWGVSKWNKKGKDIQRAQETNTQLDIFVIWLFMEQLQLLPSLIFCLSPDIFSDGLH